MRTVVSLPLRAYSIVWSPPPAFAATETTANTTDLLRRELLGRLEDTVLAGSRSPGAGYVPRVHAVLDRRQDTLVLAASRKDVEGCHPLVTAGDRLLGFLAWEEDAAVVHLLSHTPDRPRPGEKLRVQAVPVPRRIPARIHLGDRQTLRCLVEPARAIDDWPLRCTQVEDPYLASRLRSSGQGVFTDDTTDAQGRLPPGLRIGTLKIWGYPEHDIPIGLYVAPAQDPAAVCAVVLWHPAPTPTQPGGLVQAAHTPQPVRWMQMPGPAGPRWLVTAAGGVRLHPGAALVQDGVLLGTLQEPWSGQSLALPFARDRRPWSVLLLPKPESGEAWVRELCVRVVQCHDQVLTLAVTQGEVPPAGLPAGFLFTGANGLHCPMGLFLGAVVAEADRLLLKLHGAKITSPLVYVGEEGP